MKVYRLLRNNREEGPFTAEELIQKSLRPYDLIWVDGGSAAWRYPGEMAQFKQYAPLPEEENTMRQAGNLPSFINASVQAAIAVNNNLSPDIKEKPRYKISAAWSRIQTVAGPASKNNQAVNEKKTVKRNMVTGTQNGLSLKPLSWEEAWSDWEKEKKSAVSEMVHAKQPAYFNGKKTAARQKAKASPVLEKKFAQSLDSLEDKYIENLLEQKQKSKKSFSSGITGSFLLPVLALLIIFSAAYWLLNDTEMPALPSSAGGQQTASGFSNTPQTTAPVNTDQKQEISPLQKQIAAINNDELTERAKERKKTYIQPAINSNSKPAAKTTAATPALKQEAPQPVNNTIDKAQAAINNKPAAGLEVAGDNSTEPAGDVKAAKETAKPAAGGKKLISDYVNLPSHIDMRNGIANIKIENVSDADLDLVVVDVQYFNAANTFRKGETFYLHNLKAGRDVTIKTPKDEASAYAASKISLISADAKQLYIVGDN
ncbi:hypothetical protein [Parafilimonas sp.]|uniref:hypothetical protein n=1 Tax=Parafilimonas sp. TaxID=1969739 RepID=UPI0039E6BAF4